LNTTHSMIKKISTALLLSLLVTASTLAQHGDWVRVEPPGAGFSLLMPTRPAESVETKEQFTVHTFATSDGAAVFVAVYVDYVPSMKINESAELAANRDNFLKGLDARLTSSKEIKLDGRAGLEFTGEDDRRLYKSRVYILGNRVHQIASATLKDDPAADKVDRFFASFAFTAATDAHGKP